MTIALVNKSAFAHGNGATGAVDMTGADLLIIVAIGYNGDPSSISDSNGNTWISTTSYRIAFNLFLQIFYCISPSVSAAQTFSANATNHVALGFSGVSAYGAEVGYNNSGNVSATTVQPGSITPSANGSLLISAASVLSTTIGISSIDSGFTAAIDPPSGDFALGVAYLVQATAAAINPTWTLAGSAAPVAVILYFTPGAGGGFKPWFAKDANRFFTRHSGFVRPRSRVLMPPRPRIFLRKAA